MDIGRLRFQVTLQSRSTTPDSEGGQGGWTTAATVWADIRHQNGLEAIKSGADTSVVKASVRIRYRASVTAGMRLVFGSATYNITAVLPDAGKRWTDLVAEVVA